MQLQGVKILCLPFVTNNFPNCHCAYMNQFVTASYSERLVSESFLINNATNYNDQNTTFIKHDTFCSQSFGIMDVLIITKF